MSYGVDYKSWKKTGVEFPNGIWGWICVALHEAKTQMCNSNIDFIWFCDAWMSPKTRVFLVKGPLSTPMKKLISVSHKQTALNGIHKKISRAAIVNIKNGLDVMVYDGVAI